MRIAVFHNLPFGGAKRVLYEQVKHLSKQNTVDLFEYTTTEGNGFDIRVFFKNIFRYEFKIKKAAPFERIKEDLAMIFLLPRVHRQITKYIDDNGYDLVLVHPDKYTQAPILLRYLKTKTLYYCHEWLRIVYEEEYKFKEDVPVAKKIYEDISRKVKRIIDSENLKSADYVLVNSNFTRSNIKKAYDKSSKVIYPGVDTKIFKKILSNKSNQLLFVGEPVEINGYDLLVSALKLIDVKIRPKVKIIKAGSKEKLTDPDLAEQYSKSMATVCLSCNEPFGLAALESMACETPVIAVNEGGYKETVVDKRTGFLINRDAKELSERILDLMDTKFAQGMGKEGVRHVRNKFSWDSHCQLLEKEMIRLSNYNGKN